MRPAKNLALSRHAQRPGDDVADEDHVAVRIIRSEADVLVECYQRCPGEGQCARSHPAGKLGIQTHRSAAGGDAEPGLRSGQRRLIASDPTRPGELPALATSLIAVGVGLPSTTIAAARGVDAGQPVWEIWRTRSIDGTDKILERAMLPLSRVPAIDRDLLARGESLYRSLEERYGLTDVCTEQAIEVDTPGSWEAEQLELTPRARPGIASSDPLNCPTGPSPR
jgi:hypothetical protein